MMRQVRRDKGLIRLSPRDLHILTWIGEQYAVRLDSLRVILGQHAEGATKEEHLLSEIRVRHIVERWANAGLVKQRKILAYEPVWVWLTSVGLKEVGLPYKAWDAKAASLTHIHAVNQIRWRSEQRHQQATWRSERTLRNLQPETQAGKRQQHLPDGEVHQGSTVIAVEVELTQKAQQRLITIMYELTHRYQSVWYFAPPSLIAPLERAKGVLKADTAERIYVYPLEVAQ